ncbi:MAG: hypothetical protein P4K93_16525 [Terracidiphilus sp.]|nr:hypothetical protein [Terracidiphilus sp.]MDR3799757.1 hypothetical protein [Terracidiphilus sp.]
MRKRLPALALLAISSLLFAQQEMNNAAVIKLLKAGLSDDLIVTTIDASPGKYDTSADALTALREAGADSKVISAVLMKSAPGPPPSPAPPISLHDATPAAPVWKMPAGVSDPGVYFLAHDESWKALLPEPVTRKARGVAKSVATEGRIKGDVNAIVNGSSATLTLTLPVSFLIYAPEGSSAGDYLLLRFHAHEKHREFRLEKGGEFHRSSGEARDTVDFSTQQLAPRVFQINLGRELGTGEFGFLAPQDASDLRSDAGHGKMYTFSVVK